jgi:D-alanine-D-alanine ligase
MNVSILYNEPVLPPDHPDWASEAGVLEAVEAVEAALTKQGHRHRRLPVGALPTSIVAAIENAASDVIVNLCEGLEGTGAGESQVTGLLELCGVRFTGCGSECLSLLRDKARTKWLLLGAGLPTAAFQRLAPGEERPRAALEAMLAAGPAIVKPAREDASLSIGLASVVTEMAALDRQVDEVERRYGDVLVEQFIEGREFNVGVLALPEPRALPLAEIEFRHRVGDRWKLVSYDAKWTPESPDFGGTPVHCPADAAPELAAEIVRVSLAAFRLTGCRDYARVDLRVDERGRVFILELNPNPDISPSAGLARAIGVSGLSFDDFVGRLIETAVRRGAGL